MIKVIQAAFLCNDGKVYGTGPFHNLNDLQEGLDVVSEGFITDAGNYLTREELTRSEHVDHPIQSEEFLIKNPNDKLAFKLLLRDWFRKRGIKFFKSEIWSLVEEVNRNTQHEGLQVNSTAYFMSGESIEDSVEFRAAKFLSGEKPLDENTLRYAIILYENDLVAAALHAYNFDVNDENRLALKAIMNLQCEQINKSEMDVSIIPRLVDAFDIHANFVAAAVRRAFSGRKVYKIRFEGKHSKGMGIAEDPKDHNYYLLKPGSGNLSPAAGVKDISANQSEREVAFQKVAEHVGLGQFFPQAELLIVDGEEVASLELLPKDYVTINNIDQAAQVLESYPKSGYLFKWAILDYLLGNPDRHSSNILVNNTSDVKLIDHGSALAGMGFSPGTDPKSFIPYYLRAFSSSNFNKLTPAQKLAAFPRPPHGVEVNIGDWVSQLKADEISTILNHYKVNPLAVISRLLVLTNVPPALRVGFILECWAGLL